MFSRFPYTSITEINLDWIMRKLKEQISGLVASVNGKTGNVVLDASDVGALPDSYTPTYPVRSVNNYTGDVVLTAADVHALPDDYVPPVSVASVNGQTGTVVLDAADVGAMPDTYSAPVSSVNGKTGAVVLDAADVGALADTYIPPISAGQYLSNGVTWYYIKVLDYVVAFATVSSEINATASGDGTTYYGTGDAVTVPSALITDILSAGLSAGMGTQYSPVTSPKYLGVSGLTLTPWWTASKAGTTSASGTIIVIGNKL